MPRYPGHTRLLELEEPNYLNLYAQPNLQVLWLPLMWLQIRIKNPGQGPGWTTSAVWEHVKTIRGVFAQRNLLPPIIYIHNHDFNGLGGHIARELFQLAQGRGMFTALAQGHTP